MEQEENKEKYHFYENANRHEWDLPKTDEEDSDDIDLPIEDAVKKLLAPYIPVEDPKDADVYFTTKEIITALEEHYGVPQGDNSFITLDAGQRVMDKLVSLGYSYINTGGLTLQWIMKKK